jgi:hypothetical protein
MVGRAPPFSAVSADAALCGRRAALPSLIKTSVCYGFIGLYLLAPNKEKAKASLLSLAMERPRNTTAANSSDPALRNLDALLPDLADLYKDVHSHPELSMQETRTAGLAADHLRAAGFEVTPGVGKTGVVGLLRNGEGPTVMLRADMDSLPVEEATGFPMPARSPRRIKTERRSPSVICADPLAAARSAAGMLDALVAMKGRVPT